jgi:hypothetical protein
MALCSSLDTQPRINPKSLRFADSYFEEILMYRIQQVIKFVWNDHARNPHHRRAMRFIPGRSRIVQ